MWVVATDSRKRDELLFMVNRRIQRASFWSNRLDDALVYRNAEAARQKARSLKFNNPRVIKLSTARALASCNDVYGYDEDDEYDELGWDAHKSQ